MRPPLPPPLLVHIHRLYIANPVYRHSTIIGFLCKPSDDMLMESFQDRHECFHSLRPSTRVLWCDLIPKRSCCSRWCHKEQGFYEEASMKKLFDSLMCACVRRRHIIHQGWKQHVGSLGRSDEAKKIAKRISSWLYSFMKSIETLDEYKALFSSHM
ncbi:hypothetical protein IV203_025533 [Nitzschia inconspicua]|uniref:Uncharacterized protein n=1 Tax=Nitzschia inconspicua TaxID=303405 RepID=A0A9K3K415_9STRA|nr:hypothetical protein IV203_025533 [Nitzschia inconspicua]